MSTQLFADEKEMETHDIVAMMHWSQWQDRETRDGPRKHRHAPISFDVKGKFWASWHANKSKWTAAGFSISKAIDWTLNQWLTPDGHVSEGAKQKARELELSEKETFLTPDYLPQDVTLTTPQSALLYPYQREPAIRLKAALMGLLPAEGTTTPKQLLAGLNGNALDASDTGTGKTIVALVVCAELGLKPCVIAPLAVLTSWQRAAKMMDVPLCWCINYEKIRGGKSGLARWKTGTEMGGSHRPNEKFFEFTYLPNGNPILIFDEVQKCKGDTLQGQMLRDAAQAGHKILMLSATAAKDPTEMRNLGAALGLHDGTLHGFNEFQKYYGCYQSSYGYRFDWKAKKRLEELHRCIFPLRGQRIRVSEVPEFPEVSISADALDTGNTEAIKAAYEKMDRDLEKAATMSAKEKGAGTLAAIMAARVASEKGKLDLFEELTKSALDEGRSVAVFLNFRAHIAELASRFKTSSIIWGTDMNGRSQKPDERQQIIDDFQHDKTRIVFVSLQAGGAGISLHDQFNGEFPRLALISPSYSVIDLKQALGRCHRAGAKTKSFASVVFAANTIEEEICNSMRNKLSNLEVLNDGELQPAGLAEKLKGVKLEGEATLV